MVSPFLRMTIGLAFGITAALMSVLPFAAAQQPKANVATVTVTGRESGVQTSDDGAKKERYILVEVDPKTTIKLSSFQDVSPLTEELLAEHRLLTKEFTEAVKKLVQQGDFAEMKRAEAAFKLSSDEILRHVGFVTIEGSVVQSGTELVMEGKVRTFDFRKKDKDLGKGKALVEGEVTVVKYDAGKGEKATLAIQNGSSAIVLVGKLAENRKETTGAVRATGVLRAGSKQGLPVLEVESLEFLKK